MFEIWYSSGCPTWGELQAKIPADERGRVPHKDHISRWAQENQWRIRADELNGRAIQKAEDNLVAGQVAMWAEHADRAREVASQAFDYIKERGFDSSASAIQALKWAQEEERKTRGAEAFIAIVKDKSNDDLIKMVRDLATRQLSSAEEIVDVTAEEPDEGDAEPSN